MRIEKSIKVKFQLFFMAATTVLYLFTGGCNQNARQVNNPQDKIFSITDKSLPEYQNKLLNIAFETATLIPILPHIKDRSKAQEAVISAFLELDQPKRVIDNIEQIKNWRRGASYGDLAIYCAQHGHIEEAQNYINLAEKISEDAEDWRRDHIRVKIAKAYTLLGKTDEAAQFEKGVVESELGKVAGVKAMMINENYFDDHVKELDELISRGSFDITKNALNSYTFLFNNFYDDVEKRTLVEEKIKTSWRQIPIFIRIDLLMDLVKFALNHKDQTKAVLLLNEGQLFIDSAEWRPEDRIVMMAKLIELRYQAGDKETARADAEALRTLYDTEGYKIVNIDRAGVLRPLAEAYQFMGDTKIALMVYKKAIDEGVENPNSRPRAEDLSATCLSMALHAVELDEELWTRIHQIQTNLSDPW